MWTDTVRRNWDSLRKHLNFYRIHILFFSFTPLIFSAIFYASNGQFHISYIDSLFNCVSAMTVCGLAVNDLSSLTAWQQVILFILMSLGNPVLVSWVMVYIRRYYFAKSFDTAGLEALRKVEEKELEERRKSGVPLSRRLAAIFHKDGQITVVEDRDGSSSPDPEGKSRRKLNTQMIRRMDNAPMLINPSGGVTERTSQQIENNLQQDANTSHQLSFAPTVDRQQLDANNRHLTFFPSTVKRPEIHTPATTGLGDVERTRSMSEINSRPRRMSDPGLLPSKQESFRRYETVTTYQALQMQRNHHSQNAPMTKTQTVEFADNFRPSRSKPEMDTLRMRHNSRLAEERRNRRRRNGTSLEPTVTLTNDGPRYIQKSKNSEFGGFPMPHELIKSLMNRFFPHFHRRLTRTMTIPMATTIASQRTGPVPVGTKVVPYVSFNAIIGRNSSFHLLTKEQMDEVGGVEYRALNALLWIVATYHLITQILSFIVIAPYISMRRWSADFQPPNTHKQLSPPWFAIFQVVSSYTNTGMSLVDESMIPFQTAYPMILFMIFLILAGNTAFPVFLRFSIWLLTKVVPRNSRLNETLHFLLDHPRRCFIYLFPSHQTWFLLTVLILLNGTDWLSFMILDIGNPLMEAIPLGTRFLAGLLQAIAVRAAGFGIVSLSTLAPAVKVLYVVMMYISVYPIAMSVRSTNVYEEQSLGIYHEERDGEVDLSGPRVTVWGRYLAMHARKQLAFDMWWLGLAVFLVCIVERGKIDDAGNATWFTIFSIIFELVSAYGTVGLSLGVPYANYSFSGAMSPVSKVIVCLVMIRGRHRGLPVAIDRAVMKPEWARKNDESQQEEVLERASRMSRRSFGEELSDIGEDDSIRSPAAPPKIAADELSEGGD